MKTYTRESLRELSDRQLRNLMCKDDCACVKIFYRYGDKIETKVEALHEHVFNEQRIRWQQ